MPLFLWAKQGRKKCGAKIALDKIKTHIILYVKRRLKMKNLDTTLADIVCKTNEKRLAQENAVRYSRKVRIAKIKSNILLFLAIIGIFLYFCYVSGEEFKAEAGLDQNVYIICDVIETEFNENGSATLTVKMQTGDLHKYTVNEVDFEVIEVCFKTNNIDHFTTYEVVALR